jgi:hypothetical protein
MDPTASDEGEGVGRGSNQRKRGVCMVLTGWG